jgi:uncharacterized protein (UPF0276 family)
MMHRTPRFQDLTLTIAFCHPDVAGFGENHIIILVNCATRERIHQDNCYKTDRFKVCIYTVRYCLSYQVLEPLALSNNSQALLANRERIDFLEIIADNYLAAPSARAALAELCELFPVIPHGVDLSIGSVMPFDRSYLQAIKRISDLTGSPYYSEHLCMTRVPGRDIGHLAPLWFTEELLDYVIRRVLMLQDYLGKPLILENVTYMLEIPQSTMSQTEFFQRLVAATGCGVLLDVTNVFVNATNHQFDAKHFLEQMPLSHVVQVHLAGGYWKGG